MICMYIKCKKYLFVYRLFYAKLTDWLLMETSHQGNASKKQTYKTISILMSFSLIFKNKFNLKKMFIALI